MTARSTRNKMRHQVEKVMNDLERAQAHLKFLSELTEGKSPYVEKNVAELSIMFGAMSGLVKLFREGL